MPQMTAAPALNLPAVATNRAIDAGFAAELAKTIGEIVKARRGTKRTEALSDILAEVRGRADPEAPAPWENPDYQKEAGFTQLPRSDKTLGTVPESADPLPDELLAAAMTGPGQQQHPVIPTDRELQQVALNQAMQEGGSLEGYGPREFVEGGRVISTTPFEPETKFLTSPAPSPVPASQALLDAMVSDPRLKGLTAADINPAQQLVMNQMMGAGQWEDVPFDDPMMRGVASGTKLQRNRFTGETKEVVKAAPTGPELWNPPVGVQGLIDKYGETFRPWLDDPNKQNKAYQISNYGHIRDMDTKALVNIEAQAQKHGVKAGTEARVKSLQSDYDSIRTLAESGRANLEITQVLPNLEEGGVLTEAKNYLRKVVYAAGGELSPEAYDAMNDFETYSRGMAELLKNLLSTQKGPQTDSDANRLKAALPGIDDTIEGREYGLYLMEAMAHRRIQQKAFWDDWYSNHPLDGSGADGKAGYEGAEKAWDDYTRFNPIAIGIKGPKGAGRKDVLTYQDFRGQYLREGYKNTAGDDVPGIYDLHNRPSGLQDTDRILMEKENLSVEQLVDWRWRELAEQYRSSAGQRV